MFFRYYKIPIVRSYTFNKLYICTTEVSCHALTTYAPCPSVRAFDEVWTTNQNVPNMKPREIMKANITFRGIVEFYYINRGQVGMSEFSPKADNIYLIWLGVYLFKVEC